MFTPEDVFYYIYAIFHSNTYRNRYAEFLQIDFPRIPLTQNNDIFRRLCVYGHELVSLHLLKAPKTNNLITVYPITGDNTVDKGYPRFDATNQRVYINKKQYFQGVSSDFWNFQIGSYQVLDKWLKDRRNRQLSFDELMHYQKIVVALSETIRIMKEIDQTIPAWPLE